MNNNNGRDQTGWPTEVWDNIDSTVRNEVQRIAVARRVFSVRTHKGVTSVPADIIDQKRLAAEEGQEKPYIEVSRYFNLTESQCEQEGKLHTGAMLARFAATAVGESEDKFIFEGK